MGFKTPIIYVPVVLIVVHMVLSKHSRIQYLYTLKQSMQLMIQKRKNIQDGGDAKAFNDWSQNLMNEIKLLSKPSLIVEVGNTCALLSFHVVLLFLGIQFFSDLMKDIFSEGLYRIIWLFVITGLYFLLFQVHGFKLFDEVD